MLGPLLQRRVEMTPSRRGQIVGMRCVGVTFTVIEEELGVTADVARKVWNRFLETGTCYSKPRPGRPKILTERDTRHLKRYVTHNREMRRESLNKIISKLNLDAHANTLRTTLYKLGLGHRIEHKRPYLLKKQKDARLAFAKTYIHWTAEEWRRVIFTDEMGMQTGSNGRRVWVWRYPEETYKEDCCGATHVSGFKKIKVWGGMRYGALSKLVVMPEKEGEGELNAVEYMAEIMDKELFDFWQSSMEDVGYVHIMEDGTPYHMGATTARRKQYEEDGWEGWGPGTWPSSSLDLNSIENLWHILHSKIRKRRPKILKKEDLMCALVEEWEELDIVVVNHLIDSMPHRLQAVIDAKGGSTKY